MKQYELDASAVSQRLAVSPEEAARLIGVGRTTIFAALKAGRLRSSKLGARRLIKTSAIVEWIDTLETSGEGEANVL